MLREPELQRKTSRRYQPRVAADSPILICCQDPKGIQRRIRVRALDTSKTGMLVQSEEPIKPGTVVYVQTSSFSVLGKASVRHCTQKGLRYRIGLYVPDPLVRSI
jgi:hypothetical protein